jgi:hypothetical protein
MNRKGKLYEQQDGRSKDRRSKVAKRARRLKHKTERQKARNDPEAMPAYNRYRGQEM